MTVGPVIRSFCLSRQPQPQQGYHSSAGRQAFLRVHAQYGIVRGCGCDRQLAKLTTVFELSVSTSHITDVQGKQNKKASRIHHLDPSPLPKPFPSQQSSNNVPTQFQTSFQQSSKTPFTSRVPNLKMRRRLRRSTGNEAPVDNKTIVPPCYAESTHHLASRAAAKETRMRTTNLMLSSTLHSKSTLSWLVMTRKQMHQLLFPPPSEPSKLPYKQKTSSLWTDTWEHGIGMKPYAAFTVSQPYYIAARISKPNGQVDCRLQLVKTIAMCQLLPKTFVASGVDGRDQQQQQNHRGDKPHRKNKKNRGETHRSGDKVPYHLRGINRSLIGTKQSSK
ncbi:hypothetical protein NEUTE1DRAFT_108093 [Neurospora tetrasperma FGSC 2508]|uniref:Uncharacterized protein n=1 Tax=Neurospora tetrasperma (strain FGSC 2508 / ATCC MYA-4615 / P0657) TaxID=510951 RepID=F8MEM0_NEUT8|nr:uncharacterized protein NEUTE1DRAFT_108093 [Neurospora tetrasperma FGSC 2508]EGO61649.1 hypothetical protein NEUTE1DRAFT_108093 [Neurospora tetrasperma FGSC 2508]EGZ74304.1 hypothetical protein NEUTE2DRAFT_135679 [Neurospora tetrasperma FGSC 2509]